MNTAATEIITKMQPYTPNIPPNLQRTLGRFSLTDQSQEFVERGLEIATANPEMVAPTLDLQLYARVLEEYDDLRPIQTKVEQALAMINNYMRVAGATARAEFNELYRCITVLHRNGYAKATPLYEELSRLYRNKFGPRPPRPCSDGEMKAEYNNHLPLLNDARALIVEHSEVLPRLLKETVIKEEI